MNVMQMCHKYNNDQNKTMGEKKHCNTLHYIATHCNTLQHTTTHWREHTATHCNTLFASAYTDFFSHVRDMTHTYVCHDSFVYYCALFIRVWHDSCICRWYCRRGRGVCKYVSVRAWHDSIVCVTWLLLTCLICLTGVCIRVCIYRHFHVVVVEVCISSPVVFSIQPADVPYKGIYTSVQISVCKSI